MPGRLELNSLWVTSRHLDTVPIREPLSVLNGRNPGFRPYGLPQERLLQEPIRRIVAALLVPSPQEDSGLNGWTPARYHSLTPLFSQLRLIPLLVLVDSGEETVPGVRVFIRQFGRWNLYHLPIFGPSSFGPMGK
jgi:hypothetical protein